MDREVLRGPRNYVDVPILRMGCVRMYGVGGVETFNRRALPWLDYAPRPGSPVARLRATARLIPGALPFNTGNRIISRRIYTHVTWSTLDTYGAVHPFLGIIRSSTRINSNNHPSPLT